jgi:hypothetical protein
MLRRSGVAFLLLLAVAGCGNKCFYGRLQMVYGDPETPPDLKRPLSDYQISINEEKITVPAQADGTFQICNLKGKKRPDRVSVFLDGKRMQSAVSFAQAGRPEDPWIVKVAGPIQGAYGDIDTSWVPPETGTIQVK